MSPDIILASSSLTRKMLMDRLQIPYRIFVPEIDETPHPDESGAETTLRLAESKARAVAACFPQAVVLGADQLVWSGGKSWGKPGNRAEAIAQLRSFSGQSLELLTAVSLIRNDEIQSRLIRVHVRIRRINDRQIERYVDRDQPFDCAGSIRIESLGITLCERIESSDPTAILGLPLISVTDLLHQAGVSL